MRWLRRTLYGLALLAVAAVSFGVAWASMHRPWQRAVPFRPDVEAMAADRALVWEAAALLPAGTGRGPDIVVVVLDTLRADHLELYGYPHSTMPGLARWAERALVYDDVLSTSSWTLPAHASLFTGHLPSTHLAHGRTVEKDHLRRFRTGQKTTRVLERPLGSEVVTVAERLWDVGYTTLGIAANRAFLDRSWQLDQGFDLWICEDVARGASHLPYIRADRVTAMALEAVDAAIPVMVSPGEVERAPLFLFVNYMEPHIPYVPREGYVREPSKLLLRNRSGAGYQRVVRDVLSRKAPLDERVRDGWVEAYDAELRFLDEQLMALLEGLEERGIGPEAHIVILSDHGEYFGEHQLLAHSKDLYQPALRVPLVVRGAGLEPGRSEEPLQLQDVAHQIVAVAGAEALPRAGRSEDLRVAELYGSHGSDLRNAHYGRRFNRVRRSFHQGQRKVILGSDGSLEAYDLAQDPEESQDLSDAPWARDMAQRARAWEEQRGLNDHAPQEEQREPDLSPEQLETLRSLGYMD